MTGELAIPTKELDYDAMMDSALPADDPSLPPAVNVSQVLSQQHAIHGMVGRVFARHGGEEWMLAWAAKNQTKFITLMCAMTPSMQPMAGIQGDVNVVVNHALQPTDLDVVSDQ